MTHDVVRSDETAVFFSAIVAFVVIVTADLFVDDVEVVVLLVQIAQTDEILVLEVAVPFE